MGEIVVGFMQVMMIVAIMAVHELFSFAPVTPVTALIAIVLGTMAGSFIVMILVTVLRLVSSNGHSIKTRIREKP